MCSAFRSMPRALEDRGYRKNSAEIMPAGSCCIFGRALGTTPVESGGQSPIAVGASWWSLRVCADNCVPITPSQARSIANMPAESVPGITSRAIKTPQSNLAPLHGQLVILHLSVHYVSIWLRNEAPNLLDSPSNRYAKHMSCLL